MQKRLKNTELVYFIKWVKLYFIAGGWACYPSTSPCIVSCIRTQLQCNFYIPNRLLAVILLLTPLSVMTQSSVFSVLKFWRIKLLSIVSF